MSKFGYRNEGVCQKSVNTEAPWTKRGLTLPCPSKRASQLCRITCVLTALSVFVLFYFVHLFSETQGTV